MATSTQVLVQDYLKTHYRPDVEYVDGELIPRNSTLEENPLVAWAHGRLQCFIGSWFDRHEDEWNVLVAVEVRTRISSSIYRLPDVVVVRSAPEGSTITEAPFIIIEVLSPRDTYTETRRRAREYEQMGVENIWLIDPETRTAQSCTKESWVEVTRFTVEGTPIYLDVPTLFERLDKHKYIR